MDPSYLSPTPSYFDDDDDDRLDPNKISISPSLPYDDDDIDKEMAKQFMNMYSLHASANGTPPEPQRTSRRTLMNSEEEMMGAMEQSSLSVAPHSLLMASRSTGPSPSAGLDLSTSATGMFTPANLEAQLLGEHLTAGAAPTMQVPTLRVGGSSSSARHAQTSVPMVDRSSSSARFGQSSGSGIDRGGGAVGVRFATAGYVIPSTDSSNTSANSSSSSSGSSVSMTSSSSSSTASSRGGSAIGGVPNARGGRMHCSTSSLAASGDSALTAPPYLPLADSLTGLNDGVLGDASASDVVEGSVGVRQAPVIPPCPPVATSVGALHQAVTVTQAEILRSLMAAQAALLRSGVAPSTEPFRAEAKQLAQRQLLLRQALGEQRARVEPILFHQLLSAHEAALVQPIVEEIATQVAMLNVAQEELDSVYGGRPPVAAKLVAVVVRSSGAFPCVAMKHRQVVGDAAPRVTLVLAPAARLPAGATASITVDARIDTSSTTDTKTSNAAASVISSEIATLAVDGAPGAHAIGQPAPLDAKRSRTTASGAGTTSTLAVPVDGSVVTVEFPLLFPTGTRKLPARAYFRADLTLEAPYLPGLVRVEAASEGSEPFIVATHESQWSDCAGRLLRDETFAAGRASVTTWCRVANALHPSFLAATRQSSLAERPLSATDLEYISARFVTATGAQVLSKADVDALWDWTGPTFQALRFQRNASALWTKGLIYSFAHRAAVERVLTQAARGKTMVVRLSERYAGRFAVAFVDHRGSVRHYMLRATDTAGPKKTVADFVLSDSRFEYVVQVATAAHGSTAQPQDTSPSLVTVSKQVFADFAGSSSSVSANGRSKVKKSGGGYEPL